MAAKLNCAKLAKALDRKGIDINDGFPLHCAAECGHLQVAEILLVAKAGVNMRDQNGLTPLDYAVELGNEIEMVKLLLKKGLLTYQINMDRLLFTLCC